MDQKDHTNEGGLEREDGRVASTTECALGSIYNNVLQHVQHSNATREIRNDEGSQRCHLGHRKDEGLQQVRRRLRCLGNTM